MRVLIAVHGFPPTHSAGAERQAERMARWLAQHGHTVHVFAVEDVNAAEVRLESSVQDGVNIHYLYYSIHAQGDHFRNLYDNPAVGNALRQLLNNHSFDLMHLISGYLLGGQAIEAAQAFNIPVIVSPMEYWFLCTRLNLIQSNGQLCIGPESDKKCMRCLMEEKRRYRLTAQHIPVVADKFWSITADLLPFARQQTSAIEQRRTQLQTALESVECVICNSQFLINKFAEFGFNTERFVYIRQGLSHKPPKNIDTQPSHDGTLRLGYIGQIKYHKGVDLLVDATMQLLNEKLPVTLDIWGSEKEEPEFPQGLRAKSRNYPAIRWNGGYSGNKVWEVLASLDALVVPSRWYENSPNVILEAYEAGIPVIATNLGGMTELIQHERSGLLFGLNNTQDLAHQIRRLINEPELLPRLRQGIPPVKGIDEEMQETLEQYHRVLVGSQQ